LKYPTIHKLIKDQRETKDFTLYELEKLVGVTASYLSQVANGNKLPSEKVLFLITHYLGIHTDTEKVFQDGMIREYARIKEMNVDKLHKKYKDYINKYFDDKLKPLNKWADDYNKNKIQATKNTLDSTRIDKPYFDIQWLLTQNDYEVFYGRDYDIQGTQWAGKDIMDKVFFNRLNDEDIKIIHDLIEAYISNRYEKVVKKKDGE